jgi:hypothetical protein
MSQSITINSPVDVTSMGFSRNMRSFPRRIEFEGTTYSFVDAGLHATIRTGSSIKHIFTMTDGARDYRLRSDSTGWTLLSMTQ